MRPGNTLTTRSAVFDERNLLSAAGLVPVLELAAQNGLSESIDQHGDLPSARVAIPRSPNPQHPAAGPAPHPDRAAGGAPGQRRPLPGWVVCGVALSPVCHQLRAAGHQSDITHPPPPRHHRNRLRRFDRRPTGTLSRRAGRGRLRLAGLHGDRSYPAARRRDPESVATSPWPAGPPCAATWSTSRPASRPRPAHQYCTCSSTGPSELGGKPCGTTSSVICRLTASAKPCPPRHPRPDPRNPKGKLVPASGSHMPRHNRPQAWALAPTARRNHRPRIQP